MKDKKINRGLKYKLVCAAWLGTALLTFPAAVYGPHLLPLGLFRVFGASLRGPLAPWIGVVWAMYAALTLAVCSARRKKSFFIIYTVLCVLLVLNVAGCRALMPGFGHRFE